MRVWDAVVSWAVISFTFTLFEWYNIHTVVLFYSNLHFDFKRYLIWPQNIYCGHFSLLGDLLENVWWWLTDWLTRMGCGSLLNIYIYIFLRNMKFYTNYYVFWHHIAIQFSIAWFPDPKMKIVSSFTRPSQVFMKHRCFVFVFCFVLFCFIVFFWFVHTVSNSLLLLFYMDKNYYMLHKMSVSNDGE